MTGRTCQIVQYDVGLDYSEVVVAQRRDLTIAVDVQILRLLLVPILQIDRAEAEWQAGERGYSIGL